VKIRDTQAKIEAYYGTDLWGNKIPQFDTGEEELPGIDQFERLKREDHLLITVSIKQAGFYGLQQQFEVPVNVNSNLLKALDKERETGKEPVKLLLNSIASAVQSILVPLVS
jgi:hypothetical protein